MPVHMVGNQPCQSLGPERCYALPAWKFHPHELRQSEGVKEPQEMH